MQVGMTDAAGDNLHQCLPWTRRGDWKFTDNKRRAEFLDDGSLHGFCNSHKSSPPRGGIEGVYGKGEQAPVTCVTSECEVSHRSKVGVWQCDRLAMKIPSNRLVKRRSLFQR